MNRHLPPAPARNLVRRVGLCIGVLLIVSPRPCDAAQPSLQNREVAEAISQLFSNAVVNTNLSTTTTSAVNAALRDPRTRPATTNLLELAANTWSDVTVWEGRLQQARELRLKHQGGMAVGDMIRLLSSDAPDPLKRTALLELALIAEDDKDIAKALQVFAQYLARWPEDPSVPEVLLRQGLIYRQMGLSSLALTKFYATMSSALVLKVDQFDYYRRLVLQAQTEIAETYYQQGKYAESVEFLTRLLKADNPALNRPQVLFKLIRSLNSLEQLEEVIAHSRAFLEKHVRAPESPEVRFLMASAFKRLGRNSDALQQVMLLMQDQERSAGEHPDLWSYWQRRAGNEIANELFREGDFLSALTVYQSLAELDPTPEWRAPVCYQIGLAYERLEQPKEAVATYAKILEMTPTAGTNAAPGLKTVFDMASWRRDFLEWQVKSGEAAKSFKPAIQLEAKPAATPAAAKTDE